MNGKQYLVATLFALVLLTLVFVPQAHQQGGGTYDPWLDYNGDGVIDVYDVHPLGQAYGTSGDPTRNVTVTGHGSKHITVADSVSVAPADTWGSDWILIDGYSKVTISVYFTSKENLYLLSSMGDPYVTYYNVDSVANFQSALEDLVKTYDVMNEKIRVQITNYSAATASLWVEIYLMA